MPPDAPVINTAGLVFDRLGLFVAGCFFKGERVMRVRIMRGPTCEGKGCPLLVSREAHLVVRISSFDSAQDREPVER